jgi:hypothetical protein
MKAADSELLPEQNKRHQQHMQQNAYGNAQTFLIGNMGGVQSCAFHQLTVPPR